MNKNKKRIIALAGVTGMILSLSCHLLDMPIQAKEASITLIKDPVYTDHDKVALFPETQDTKEAFHPAACLVLNQKISDLS